MGMRIVGLLLVVALAGFIWSRRGAVTGSSAEVDDLMATPSPRPGVVAAATPAKAPAPPATSGLRQPIDRTRSVLEKVKARNGDGEF